MAWPEKYVDSTMTEEVLARIKNAVRLTSFFGTWPDFQDGEVLSVFLDRGNLHEILETQDCGTEILLPSLTLKLFVFDWRMAFDSPLRKNYAATLRFDGLSDFYMEQFSHQNPTTGLAIHAAEPRNGQVPGLLRVELGGTALGFETDFLCESISVLDVEPFDPTFGSPQEE